MTWFGSKHLTSHINTIDSTTGKSREEKCTYLCVNTYGYRGTSSSRRLRKQCIVLKMHKQIIFYMDTLFRNIEVKKKTEESKNG